MPNHQEFIVLFREAHASRGDKPVAFACSAENADKAEDLCMASQPLCDVLWTELGSNIDNAYAHYYSAASGIN